ncbi:tyrosine--tRNA ligase [Paraburkholderia acidipaludis]|uniref:tyrosine--tRNA ligase n=1 Tax=Paraburkholderia acidipaludis TaxID=660537 RepID=UPI0005B967C8|nr:tyrosine--tRNA ligase [Paraburkholderia acidipaludis]
MASNSHASLDKPTSRSNALRTLTERGYINQCTNLEGLDALFDECCVPVYLGFDATADSLHVGHLMAIMALRHLQQCGHKPIVLVGGGTTRIGDPSFRSEARPMLTDEQIAINITGIRKAFSQYLEFGDGPTDAVMFNNAEWLDSLSYLGMLRDVGRHFSVNRMLSFDSVKSRLDRQEGLSLLEFNYMVLQAYDFVELSRRIDCRVQLGGTDQWGNIVSGVDLVRRVDGKEVFGLTVPLLTTASGAKMGKTASGAVWLNADRLSPYEYWQFWRNTEDGDVARFLRLFTDLSLDEITHLVADLRVINEAKKRLADEATRLAHGADAARRSAETARLAFEEGTDAGGLPSLSVTAEELGAGIYIVDLLVNAGLAASKSDARRLIAGNGVRIGGGVIGRVGAKLTEAEFGMQPQVRLSVGRKRHVLIVLSESDHGNDGSGGAR